MSTGQHCRITVLMSVFNGEKFLREAIDSILAQTFHDFEFVIYDDCSTDQTPDIIQSYKDSRIVYRRNTVNRGLTCNLAEGVALSNSQYIARMDADDIAYPKRLETQLQWMDEHPDIAILGSAVNYFNKTPGDNGIAPQPQDDATIKATLFISFTLMHPSIMIRRQTLINHGVNYNTEYRYSQDHALYFDCIKAGLKFANYPAPLVYMRSHEKSISKHRHSEQQECSQRIRLDFLRKTGIASECTEDEIAVYNYFASGIYPLDPKSVYIFEKFVSQIYDAPITAKYFNVDILRQLMAEKLCNGAYCAIRIPELKASALAARKSYLVKYTNQWTIKRRLKFQILRLLS